MRLFNNILSFILIVIFGCQSTFGFKLENENEEETISFINVNENEIESFNSRNLILNGVDGEIIIRVTGDSTSVLSDQLSVSGEKANIKIINPNGIVCNSLELTNIETLTLEAGEESVIVDGIATDNNIKINGSKVEISGPINSKFLRIDANDVKNIAEIKSGSINIHAEKSFLDMGSITSNYDSKITSKGDIVLWKSKINTFGMLEIEAPNVNTTEAMISSLSTLSLKANSIACANTQYSSEVSINIDCDSFKHRFSAMNCRGNVSIQAGKFDNVFGIINSAGKVTINSQEVKVNGGEIESADDITINASKFTLERKYLTESEYQGSIKSAKEINIECESFHNEGHIYSNLRIIISADYFKNLYKIDGDVGIIKSKLYNHNKGDFIFKDTLLCQTTEGSFKNEGEINAKILSLEAKENVENDGSIDTEMISLTAGKSIINRKLISYKRKYNTDVFDTPEFINLGEVKAPSHYLNIPVICNKGTFYGDSFLMVDRIDQHCGSKKPSGGKFIGENVEINAKGSIKASKISASGNVKLESGSSVDIQEIESDNIDITSKEIKGYSFFAKNNFWGMADSYKLQRVKALNSMTAYTKTNSIPTSIHTKHLFLLDTNEKEKKELIFNGINKHKSNINFSGYFGFDGKKFINNRNIECTGMDITLSHPEFSRQEVSYGSKVFANKSLINVKGPFKVKIDRGNFFNEKNWWYNNKKDKYGQECLLASSSNALINANSIDVEIGKGHLFNLGGAIIESTDENAHSKVITHNGNILNSAHGKTNHVKKCHEFNYDEASSAIKTVGNIALAAENGYISNQGSDINVGKDLIIKAGQNINLHPAENKDLIFSWKRHNKYETTTRLPTLTVGGVMYGETENGDIIIDSANVFLNNGGEFNSGGDFTISSMQVQNECGVGGKKGVCGNRLAIGADERKMLSDGFSNEIENTITSGNGKGVDFVGGNIYSGGDLFVKANGKIDDEAGTMIIEGKSYLKAPEINLNYASHSYLDKHKKWTRRRFLSRRSMETKEHAVSARAPVIATNEELVLEGNVRIKGATLFGKNSLYINGDEVEYENGLETVENYIHQKKSNPISRSSRKTRWSSNTLIPSAMVAGEVKIEAGKFKWAADIFSEKDIDIEVDELEIEGKRVEKYRIVKEKSSGITFPGLVGAGIEALDSGRFEEKVKRNDQFLGALDSAANRRSSKDFAPVINAGVETYKKIDNAAGHYQDSGSISNALGDTLYDMTGLTQIGSMHIPGGIGFVSSSSHLEERMSTVISPKMQSLNGNVNIIARKASTGAFNIDANNIKIEIDEDLKALAGKSESQTTYKSKSSNVGFSFSQNAAGVSYGESKAHSTRDAKEWIFSYINGKNSVEVTVNGEALLQGQINSPNIKISSAKLILETLQDVYEVKNDQSGFSVGLSVSANGLLPSVSVARGKGSGQTIWAREQSAISGDNLQINAEELTLVGSVILGKKGNVSASKITYSNVTNNHSYDEENYSLNLDVGAISGMMTLSANPGDTAQTVKNAASASQVLLGTASFGEGYEDSEGINRATISEALEINTDSDISGLNRDMENAVEVFYLESDYYSFALPIPNLSQNGLPASWKRISGMFEDIINSSNDNLATKLITAQKLTEIALEEFEKGSISAEEAEEAINESTHLSEIEENVKKLTEYYEDSEAEMPAEVLQAILDGWTPIIGDNDELNFIRNDLSITLTTEEPLLEVGTTDVHSNVEISDIYRTDDGRTNTEKIADNLIDFADKTANFIERHPLFAKYGIPALTVAIRGSFALMTGGAGLGLIVAETAIASTIAYAAADQIGAIVDKALDKTAAGINLIFPELSEERTRALAGAALIAATLGGSFGGGKVAAKITKSISKKTGGFKKYLNKKKLIKKTDRVFDKFSSKRARNYYNTLRKNANLKINKGKQAKHILDNKKPTSPHSREIINERKSILTHKDPQSLVDRYAGTGVPAKSAKNIPPGQFSYKEVVDFKETVGFSINEHTGEKTLTTIGTIHYAKNGVHVVPKFPN